MQIDYIIYNTRNSNTCKNTLINRTLIPDHQSNSIKARTTAALGARSGNLAATLIEGAAARN